MADLQDLAKLCHATPRYDIDFLHASLNLIWTTPYIRLNPFEVVFDDKALYSRTYSVLFCLALFLFRQGCSIQFLPSRRRRVRIRTYEHTCACLDNAFDLLADVYDMIRICDQPRHRPRLKTGHIRSDE